MADLTSAQVAKLSTSQLAAYNALLGAKGTLKSAQSAFAIADPVSAQAAQVAAEQNDINSYIAEKKAILTQSLSDSQQAGAYLRNLTDIVGTSADHVANLQQQADELTNQQLQYGQKIRTQRRAFMDQFPQSGTGGYFFHHTADDFTLLVFLIGFIAAYYMVYSRYVTSSSWPMRLGGVLIFVFAWFAAIQVILRFG